LAELDDYTGNDLSAARKMTSRGDDARAALVSCRAPKTYGNGQMRLFDTSYGGLARKKGATTLDARSTGGCLGYF